jgi:hypothetical protein
VGQPRQVAAAARERVRRPAVRVLFYYCSSSFLFLFVLMSLSLVSLVHRLLPACLHSLTRHESNHHPLSLPKSINHQSTYSHYSLLPYRYFSREPSGVVSSWQVGVIRTNCMDNLDRTNVVQSLFARRSLLWQLNKAEAKDVMNTPYVFCYTMSLLPSFSCCL